MDNEIVQGGDRLRDRIAKIRNTLGVNLIVDQVGELLLRRTLERFDREEDPDGRAWKPLSEGTLKRRMYAGASGKKMLVRTGLMRESIKIIKGGLGTTFTNTGAGLRIGIAASAKTTDGEPVSAYARIQNQRRRFMGVSRQDVQEIDALLQRRGNEAIE